MPKLKFYQYFLPALAILVAIFILMASFQSASKSELSDTASIKTRRFYVKKEILPDHSFYPVLMAADRFRLAMADQERRSYLLAAYANRRLFYAIKLLEKGERALSLTTFSKAEKYLNRAIVEATALKKIDHHDENYDELIFFILQSIEEHAVAIEQISSDFNCDELAVLTALQDQTNLLRSQIDQ